MEPDEIMALEENVIALENELKDSFKQLKGFSGHWGDSYNYAGTLGLNLNALIRAAEKIRLLCPGQKK